MSLLLEALKKAKKADRDGTPPAQPVDAPEDPRNSAPADNDTAPSEPTLSEVPPLEFSVPEQAKEAPEPFQEIVFPELNFAESPEIRPEPNQPATSAPAPATPADLEMDFQSPPIAQAEPSSLAPMPPLAESIQLEFHEPPTAQVPEDITPKSNPVRVEPTLSFEEPPPFVAPLPKAEEPSPSPQAVKPEPVIAPPPVVESRAAPEVKTEAAPPKNDNTAESEKQATAKKVFSAKGLPKRNLKLLGGLLLASLVIGAAGGYYYLETISQPTVSVPRHPSPPQPGGAVAPALTGGGEAPPVASEGVMPPPPAVQQGGQSAIEKAPLPTVPDSKPVQSKAAQLPSPSAPPTLEAPPPSPPTPAKPTSTDKESPATSAMPGSAIKIRQGTVSSKLDPLLDEAYQAFVSGDLDRAESAYLKSQQKNPNSVDTLLGLAAVATKRQRIDDAVSYYIKVLNLDPKDATAQAGLIALKGLSDLPKSESRLKTLLSQHPNTGYLHFALGNLYARQSRWPEAQEAYFNAFRLDPYNADYAFNLAVGLDHLEQHKLALDHYQRALNLSKERPSDFNQEAAAMRMRELQSLQP